MAGEDFEMTFEEYESLKEGDVVLVDMLQQRKDVPSNRDASAKIIFLRKPQRLKNCAIVEIEYMRMLVHYSRMFTHKEYYDRVLI